MHLCKRCNAEKPPDAFRIRRSGVEQPCKACKKEKAARVQAFWEEHGPAKAWRRSTGNHANQSEDRKAARKWWRLRHPEGGRHSKVCPRCEERKPLTDFAKSAGRSRGVSSRCKACYSKVSRERRYGLTEDEYQGLFEDQGGVCALCPKPLKMYQAGSNSGSASVDHCHETGKVRGLLCRACNGALGALGDSREGLLAALAYVEGRPFKKVITRRKRRSR